MATRFDKNTDWFEMWMADKESLLQTMIANMRADLEAGYNYFGQSITNQREQIDAYKAEIDAKHDELLRVDFDSVNRWCFYDLKKRGAIE